MLLIAENVKIPGYGRSSPSKRGDDKRTIGLAILGALRTLLPPDQKQNLLITGHDRGARICHRLAVDDREGLGLGGFLIRGTILLDIVPTLTQWESFQDSANSTGSFHWPLLANVRLATSLIKAQGGDKFCRSLIEKWAGKDADSLRLLNQNDALKVYTDFFTRESVIRASCQDYRAGADEDVQEQKSDQISKGARIGCPALIVFSSEYLGGRFDVRTVWSKWVKDTAKLFVEEISGSGHFVAEEAPKATATHINNFWHKIVHSNI